MVDEVQIGEIGPGAELQNALRQLAKDLPYFSNVVVITEKMKEITYEVERVLSVMSDEGGSAGVAVLIFLPDLQVTRPNLPGPVFDGVPIIGRVIENVMINQSPGGTGKCAHDVAIALARAWHLKFDPKLYDPILVEGITSVTDSDFADCVIKDVKAKTKLKK